MNLNYFRLMNQYGNYVLIGAGVFIFKQFVYTVQPGSQAIVFSRFSGLKQKVYKEGWHLRIPYFEIPIIFNIQTKPTTIKCQTANKDMQTINLALRVLYRPKQENLQQLYRYCGNNYDEKVLPSIVNEVLKSIIARFTAIELLSLRDEISYKIRKQLEDRARKFHVIIDDVSIVDLQFSPEFKQAIEAKQVAQQEAEQAKYIVQREIEQKKSRIIKAQGEARSIELLGKAVKHNPSYMKLRQIEYAKDISDILAEAQNSKILLDSNILNLDIKEKSKPSFGNIFA